MNEKHMTFSRTKIIVLACILSLGATVSLGISRFSYGLLLSPMRTDLSWSYTLAGAMNTANALGYLIGALATPSSLRRFGPNRVFIAGAIFASIFMAASGFFTSALPLLLQRLLAGIASAFVFIAGGLLAARLANLQTKQGGFILGLYYGGTGLGIALSALLVPFVLSLANGQPHSWAWAWWALALICVVATIAMHWPASELKALGVAPTAQTNKEPINVWLVFRWGLAGYAMFGIGYIGYMTFVIALLREHGVAPSAITLFYTLLGIAVMTSPHIWAGLLDRHRGGKAMAYLNALLGFAIILPALTNSWPLVLISGLVFGGVFVSVVASTTALVRHNLSPAQWADGISGFTIVFAIGQIIGPTMVGWIADGEGGLARGLLLSAFVLWLGAVLAWRQQPLPNH
jgi:MFS family permease